MAGEKAQRGYEENPKPGSTKGYDVAVPASSGKDRVHGIEVPL